MKRSSAIVIAFLFFFVSTQGQHAVRLNNGWEFIRQDLASVWEAVRPVAKAAPESVPLWQSVTLPHCYNAEDGVDPDVNYYQGPAWYRTRLSIANPYNDGRTVLHFEGAGQKTQVYIYTTLVGAHVGGYDEFSIDITDAVEVFRKTEVCQKQFKGNIPLSIRVDNSRDIETIPSRLSDFNVYGGIYRYLNLEYLPALSLDKLFVSAQLETTGKKGNLLIRPKFYNPSGQQTAQLNFRLFDPNGVVLGEIQKEINPSDTSIAFSMQVNKPTLWSPDDPKLYTVQATLGNYKRAEQTGFKTAEFKEKGPFFLNGKRLLLRGTHRHEDHAGVGAAMTEEMMRQEMILIKQMGVNFIRLGHYQQSPIILHLCDSLGILVWEEIPWCRGGIGGTAYQEQARRMLGNMISQHYNHPSVIIWGLGNENDWPGDFPQLDKEKIRSFMKELNDLAHRLDPRRKTAIRRCDFCSDIVDVYSPSIWMGWYRGLYTEYKQVSETEMQKVNRFLHVEWGGDSHAGRNAENVDQLLQSASFGAAANDSLFTQSARLSKDDNWNESYACNLIDWHLKEQETMPWLTGTAQWAFKDFSTPLRPDNPVPYVNQKGVVERDFTKKEAYYVFQSYWTTSPMVHLFSHNWPVRWGAEGEERMIKVYSNCEEAELFINGKSIGKKKRNSQDFPAAGLRWNVSLHQGGYEVKVVATKGKTVVTDSIRFRYETRKWGAAVRLQVEKKEEANGIATVEVNLLDANGVICLDSASWLRFGLSGDGKLIDDQGTSTGSRYVQLFNGRGLIRIRTNGGKSVVSASVEGVPTSFITL